VAETSFAITYDGPALADGRMPVRELAPALLALGDLFADASSILYPDREPVGLSIEATREGSFDVHLVLEAKRTWDQLVDIFGSDGATALVNLKDLVILGVFWLVKRLRGRRVASHAPSPNRPGVTRLTLDDGTTLDIPTEALRLYESIEIRRKAREVVDPLTREGVERVIFVTAPDPTTQVAEPVVIEEDDVPAYDLAELPPEPLLDREEERILEIVSVVFTEGRKWRFGDGEASFNATIEDDSFVARVDSGFEAFRKGDVLRCRVRIVQSQRIGGGLHTEYTVREVLEHIPRPTQLSIDDPS
jgi:hypothetical protein